MFEANQLIAAVIVGGVTSLLYFGGLWMTVSRLPDSTNPLVLYTVSFIIRIAVLLYGVLLLLQLGWQLVLAALAGFLVVRYGMTHTIGCRTAAPAPLSDS